MEIQTRFDSKRGCGYRKVGGTYLMGPAPQAACCKLPFALTVCPTCHAGIKPTRGWTWVDAAVLFATQPCADPSCGCPLDDCGRLTSKRFRIGRNLGVAGSPEAVSAAST